MKWTIKRTLLTGELSVAPKLMPGDEFVVVPEGEEARRIVERLREIAPTDGMTFYARVADFIQREFGVSP